jgi:hypothetical protein
VRSYWPQLRLARFRARRKARIQELGVRIQEGWGGSACWAKGCAETGSEWDPPSPSLRRDRRYETNGTNETARISPMCPIGPIHGPPWRVILPNAGVSHLLFAIPRSGYPVHPPSTTCICPVVKADSSDARYTARAAISSGRPRRPIGCRAMKASRTSVSVLPSA